MPSPQMILIAAGLLFLAIGGAVFWKQATATSCPRHCRQAGAAARVVGWVAIGGGAMLLGYGLLG